MSVMKGKKVWGRRQEKKGGKEEQEKKRGRKGRVKRPG